MRNIFDQYDGPENRLTHALATALSEDRRLLTDFLRWLDVESPVPAAMLSIDEQALPGEAVQSEEEAERRGLPDVVIYHDDGWCFLIESKIEAALTEDQLRRHERTLRRRGFEEVRVLALTKANRPVPPRVLCMTWADLYEWLGKGKRSEWCERLRGYLRVAEGRLAQGGYLKEGTLTRFDGFPFSDQYSYTYLEAKRLLKLALGELRKDKRLLKLGIDPNHEGRPAITGRESSAVWDFLSLRGRSSSDPFTSHPHLTLAVHASHLEVALTIPNGVAASVRQALGSLGVEGLAEVNAAVLRRAAKIIKAGGWVEAAALQRHYSSQRAKPMIDASMTFRLETSMKKNGRGVKQQPEWLELFAALPTRKRSNLQFQYRVHLPWRIETLRTRGALDVIVDAWSSLTPLLEELQC